jgi:hypothetical protein
MPGTTCATTGMRPDTGGVDPLRACLAGRCSDRPVQSQFPATQRSHVPDSFQFSSHFFPRRLQLEPSISDDCRADLHPVRLRESGFPPLRLRRGMPDPASDMVNTKSAFRKVMLLSQYKWSIRHARLSLADLNFLFSTASSSTQLELLFDNVRR